MKDLIDALYDAQYLHRLQDLRAKSQWAIESLSQSRLKKMDDSGFSYIIGKLDPSLREKLRGTDLLTVMFGLDKLFYGSGKFSDRLDACCDLLDLSDWDLGFLLFYTAPKSFFPPHPLVIAFFQEAKSRTADASFLQFTQVASEKWRTDKNHEVFPSPMELFAALLTIMDRFENSKHDNSLVDTHDERMFSELIDSIRNLSLYRLNPMQITWIRDLFKDFSDPQRIRMMERMRQENIHPFIRRVITKQPKQGVIVDGSNIIFSGLLQPDPLRLRDLMNALGAFPTLFFPIRFVFDANVDYIIPTNHPFWNTHFQSNPDVVRFSPADEWIIQTAYEQKYAVISNDQYRQHQSLGLQIYHFFPHQVRLCRKEDIRSGTISKRRPNR